jgi:hypothetical protein
MNSTSRFGELKGLGAVAWVFSTYPVLLVFSLYITWALACLSLGHMPRPSQDDPKHISSLVSCFHVATGLLLLGSYVALPANAFFILLEVVHRVLQRRWNVVLLVAAPVLSWLCLFFIMLYDPGKIAYWFFD